MRSDELAQYTIGDLQGTTRYHRGLAEMEWARIVSKRAECDIRREATLARPARPAHAGFLQ